MTYAQVLIQTENIVTYLLGILIQYDEEGYPIEDDLWDEEEELIEEDEDEETDDEWDELSPDENE